MLAMSDTANSKINLTNLPWPSEGRSLFRRRKPSASTIGEFTAPPSPMSSRLPRNLKVRAHGSQHLAGCKIRTQPMLCLSDTSKLIPLPSKYWKQMWTVFQQARVRSTALPFRRGAVWPQDPEMQSECGLQDSFWSFVHQENHSPLAPRPFWEVNYWQTKVPAFHCSPPLHTEKAHFSLIPMNGPVYHPKFPRATLRTEFLIYDGPVKDSHPSGFIR
ncbi:hypothetical protein B0J18DRAFT_31946 [Chaetomium sp. MPI-SDFR-AT-0129]|nr:hypothetical protein B0J18DRAFT_31946 [Chaetomium sp. MPI-SDFR-AT-0129]